MAKIRIEIDDRLWFHADVDGFDQPPPLPDNPQRIPVSALPDKVRELLDQALLKGLEQVGIRVTKWERVD